LEARVEAGTPQAGSGVTISTGVWYRFDVKYDTSGATWTFDWQVDGVVQTQATEGGHSTSTGFKRLDMVVFNSAAVTTNYNVDDVAGSLTSGDYPIGPGRVLLAPLEGTTAHQSITTTQWQSTSDFSAFTNFTGDAETVTPPLLRLLM
jgi:hypothetical protein